MIKHIKKAVKWTFTPLLDEEGFPSLTNISLVAAFIFAFVVKDISGVGVLSAAFAHHAHKRQCIHKQTMKAMENDQNTKMQESQQAAKVITDTDKINERLDAHSDAIEDLADKYKKAEIHKTMNTQTMPEGQFNVDANFMNQFLPPRE